MVQMAGMASNRESICKEYMTEQEASVFFVLSFFLGWCKPEGCLLGEGVVLNIALYQEKVPKEEDFDLGNLVVNLALTY